MTAVTARHRWVGLALAAIIFIVDQAVKWLVTGPLQVRDVGDFIEILPFFDLRFTQNFGVSLGMFTATSPEMRWALVAVTATIAAVVFIWMLREKALGEIIALALVLGGALGNIRDRVKFGYVVDYADFHIGDFRPFLIFNIADAAITIGVVIILARSLFMREKPTQLKDDDTAQQAAEN